jgi:hypothetical protein
MPFEFGQYDYSNIQLPPQGALPELVSQARAAFQVATNVEAERLAQAEFRQARVALETTEEMLRRSAPPEIILPSANEAIRKSHRAAVVARERVRENELQGVRNEVASLRAEKEALDGRIAEITRQMSAVNDEVRGLRVDLTTAGQDKDQLSFQRDQALTRARNAETELAQLKQRQEEQQARLTLTLLPEFFDEMGLTEIGRDALFRLSSIAEVIQGPIRLDGEFSETALEAALQFLVLSGIPQDRITTRR